MPSGSAMGRQIPARFLTSAMRRSLWSSVGENLSGGSWNATRAEMAVMLQQFVKLTEK